MDKKKTLGVFFVLLSILIVSVTAIVYESAQQTVSQTIKDIGALSLTTPALGDIEEGETMSYTEGNVTALGDAISITTTKPGLTLHLDSNLDSLSTYYTTYNITIKYATVPGGSSHSGGQIATTITIGAPGPADIDLDLAGSWKFDFEITTTAKSVSADQATAATIDVSVQS